MEQAGAFLLLLLLSLYVAILTDRIFLIHSDKFFDMADFYDGGKINWNYKEWENLPLVRFGLLWQCARVISFPSPLPLLFSPVHHLFLSSLLPHLSITLHCFLVVQDQAEHHWIDGQGGPKGNNVDLKYLFASLTHVVGIS